MYFFILAAHTFTHSRFEVFETDTVERDDAVRSAIRAQKRVFGGYRQNVGFCFFHIQRKSTILWGKRQTQQPLRRTTRADFRAFYTKRKIQAYCRSRKSGERKNKCSPRKNWDYDSFYGDYTCFYYDYTCSYWH